MAQGEDIEIGSIQHKPDSSIPIQSERSNTALEFLEDQPTFIPKFLKLRRSCLEHTANKIGDLERSLADSNNAETRSKKLDEAVLLLRALDDQCKSDIKRRQLEDPTYADDRGIEVINFVIDADPNRGQWMMISQPWGEHSKSLRETAETAEKGLPEQYKFEMDKFAGGSNVSKVSFKRKKRFLERQPGAIRYYKDRTYKAFTRIKHAWTAVFILAIVVLFVFFGVGVIATNSTFSLLFEKIFFWVAIVWTLAASVILAWLVKAFGGSNKEILTVFMTSIAIWLVVIQIGQTHLITQITSS